MTKVLTKVHVGCQVIFFAPTDKKKISSNDCEHWVHFVKLQFLIPIENVILSLQLYFISPFILHGTILKGVDKFKYLGTFVMSDRRCLMVLKNIITQAEIVFLKMKNILCNRSLSLSVKEKDAPMLHRTSSDLRKWSLDSY